MTEHSSIQIRRPRSIHEVACNSDSQEAFGYALRDFQHHLQSLSRRADFEKAFEEEPPFLRGKLRDKGLADAYLAAYVEEACRRFKLNAPAWIHSPRRLCQSPWYASNSRRGRQRLLLEAPASFRDRNLFTVPDYPFRPKPGRPRTSDQAKRQKNAERQKRYRQRLKQELEQLRQARRLRKSYKT